MFALGAGVLLAATPYRRTSEGETLDKSFAEISPDLFILPVHMAVDSPVVELPFPLEDREGDFYSNPNYNPFDLQDPSLINKHIEYDPETGEYIIVETYDHQNYRPPGYIDFDDFLNEEFKRSEEEYWRQRARGVDLLGRSEDLELFKKDDLLGKFLSGSTVEIRPQGSIELLFGGTFQNIQNPTLPQRAQRNGGFDFNMNINMSVTGQIGDKMKINTNYNTQPSFNFDNQIKLNYEGSEDEIVQNVEAGNVSFPLPTSLITGSQSLFGLKSKLKFGRLTVTSVLSQQKSKRDNIQIEGGAQTRDFEVSGMQYDENRHFFLAQYFRDHYEEALKTLPVINSPIQITRIEVWVTNSTGVTQNTRDVVAFMDLGESTRLFDTVNFSVIPGPNVPNNGSNTLYQKVINSSGTRSLNTVVNTLTNKLNLKPITSYEKTRARQLQNTEYTLHPRLGFISLNQALKPDEVLGVAFEYTYQGKTFRVGEFSQDVPIDPQSPNVLFLKMLKSTSARPKLPIWDLMMKNIYSLGAYQVNSEDFFLDIYYQDPGGGNKRYIPEGEGIKSKAIIKVMGLDRLNNQLDPQADGVFDFVPGITIDPQKGRIIFPVVEPFGSHLKNEFIKNGNPPELAEKYTFQKLYDSTRIVAEQFPQFDRFLLKGRYKSKVSSEIYLGTFNLPKGSVSVTAGGQKLLEGRDYTIDYNLGRIKIINDGILNSGVPINVSFENNNQFGFQQKTMIGNRFDYWISDNFTLGATQMHLSERPYTQKVNFGSDPISNSIYGADLHYNKNLPSLTRMLDNLPVLKVNGSSSINVVAEGAYFNPGHNKAIDQGAKGDGGIVYIDDFEGTRTYYDLRFPFTAWSLASTPKGAVNGNGQELFPEAGLFDSLLYGYNRAKLVWYSMDPLFFQNRSSTPDYIKSHPECQSSHYVRIINEQEIFERETQLTFQQIATFDLMYMPKVRGPYNFESTPNGVPGISSGLNPDGTLKNPQSRWGGITRALETNDFEAANVEYIDFWVMDPFDNRSGSGEMYINLGNVSEDVLKDSRNFFENGLPENDAQANLDTTGWGVVPNNQAITNAFSTDPAVLKRQDLGFDGLSSEAERDFFAPFISRIQTMVNNGQLNAEVLDTLSNDPSSDDFVSYLAPELETAEICVLPRYRNYDGAEGNTYATIESDRFQQGSNLPNTEDLNRDNTLNENEEYYQYRIPMFSGMSPENNPYITDVVVANASFPDGTSDEINWYHFQIPIYNYDSKVGGIQDFRSIRFMRMFLTGFNQKAILRFARLQLVRNQWRRYRFSLASPGEYLAEDGDNETFFNVSAVSVEENSKKQPIPYLLPPGVEREQFIGNNTGTPLLQNEQSMQLEVCGLQDGDAKAVFKTLNFDFRQYKRLQLFFHAEDYNGKDKPAERLKDGEMHAFVRLGNDFTENYYEIAIPLKVTNPDDVNGNNEGSRRAVWPDENLIDIALDSLRLIKQQRNLLGVDRTIPYTLDLGNGRSITIIGNPNLGLVKVAMIGLRNPKENGVIGRDLCAEVWTNEFRLVGMDEQGGGAGLLRADLKLADLGDVQLSGSMHTIGFGQLEQRVNDRYRDNYYQYNAATNLQLGKLLPEFLGLSIPMYAGISETFSRPEYDPYDLDIPVNDRLTELQGVERKEYLKQIQDYTSIKSLNFTNIRKNKSGKGKSHFYDLSNINLTYAYNEILKRNPLTEYDLIKRYKGGLAYNYSGKANYIEPFKKLIPMSSKWLRIIRDINLNPMPNSFSFRTDINRQYGELVLRDLYGDALIDTSYNKFFNWDRFYDMRWDITKSLKLNLSATAKSRIDEPEGKIDKQWKKDSIWSNIKHLGRNTDYFHTITLNYQAPFKKIPLLDWLNARAAYSTDYNWKAASLVVDSFGNDIRNSRSIRVNADANLNNLYRKIPILKLAVGNTRQRTGGRLPRSRSNKKEEKKPGEKEDKKEKELSAGVKGVLGVIMGLKRVSFNYNKTEGSMLPGFMPDVAFLGLSDGFSAPGWPFVLGFQPDSLLLNEFAAREWMTRASSFNFQHTRNITENYDLKATIEPVKGMTIDLNWSHSLMSNYSEFFKFTGNTGDGFEHLNPQWQGSFKISFMAVNTMFDKRDSSRITETYKQFEANRITFSNILGELNPYSSGSFEEFNVNDTIRYPDYADGYGPYSQAVLIPAFIAAYTGKTAQETSLDIFANRPKPNWRFRYSGLSKVKPFDKIFSSLNISHGYNSSLTVNNFKTDFQYGDSLKIGFPSERDTLFGNFYSLYVFPNVTIMEQFAPLIGIDMTLQNGVTARFEYKKSRSLSLSLIDYQLIERGMSEITFGAGYRVKGVRLPFKIQGEPVELENELTFKLDFSYRNDITMNYRMDQNIAEPTQGARSYSISPSAMYVVNNRLSIRLYFDHKKTKPWTSISYPISNTNAGIAVRFTLAE